MDILVLGRAEVRELLPMSECIDVMAEAMEATARRETLQPLRWIMALPGDDGAAMGTMPGYLGNLGRFGIKVVSVFPENFGTRYQSHQGAVLLFEREHGSLIAIMHAGEITAIRTAAASGLATRILSREDSSVLALLGYGEQAATHLRAMQEVRDVRRVKVWGRSRQRAERFAKAEGRRHAVDIEVSPSVREAVRGADLICTVTAAPDPILKGAWLPEGCHLNVVGSSVARFREVDTEAVARSRLYVDLKSMTLAEGGEYLRAVDEGAIDESHILGEIGQVLIGAKPGRRSASEITMYKSLGIPAEDLASAQHLYARARRTGLGTWVDF